MPSPRIACLLVPDLPLRAELRAHPELADEALVIASSADARGEVVAVSERAAREGVHRGATIAQARAACPALTVRVAKPALDQAARDTLLDIGLSMSPRVALGERSAGFFSSEGSVFLDAAGIDALFRSERGFASALSERAARQGLPGIVALASSRTIALLVARGLTRQPGAIEVLDPEEERSFLEPLPLDLLDPDDQLAEALTRFGVRTVRDLLRLPRRSLAKRLGAEVLALVDRALGREPEPPLPEPVQQRVEESMDLESPIDRLEPLTFVLRGLIGRVSDRLALRALSCSHLQIGLRLEGGGRDVRRIGLAAPSLDVRVLLRLTTQALTSHPPDAAVEAITVQTEGVPNRTDQLDLFAPRGPDPAALDRTLSELESLCGTGRVGAPEVVDSHHPHAFGQKPFDPPKAVSPETRPSSESDDRCAEFEPRPGSSGHGPALRAIRPPVRAEVRVHQGRPAHVRSAVTQGDVIVASGPWRSTGHWWSQEERFALDHFDAQISDGFVVRLCFDWVNRLWQIDGVYD